jgi:hypothetical protein
MMEGRISKEFYGIQCLHLSYSHSRINGNFWMTGFRNFTLHHDTQCSDKQLKDKQEVQLQINVFQTQPLSSQD